MLPSPSSADHLGLRSLAANRPLAMRRMRNAVARRGDRIVNHLSLLIQHAAPQPPTESSASKLPTNRKIFVVHGHDEEMKQRVARTLLQLALEPIILHEQHGGSRTIIEKFEKNSRRGLRHCPLVARRYRLFES